MRATIPTVPDDSNAIGYRRVSKAEQGEDWKASLEEQTRAVIAWAKANAIDFDPNDFFEDRMSSDTFELRPAFQALYAHCASHQRSPAAPGRIIVLCASRFGRPDDPEESAFERVRFRKLGWEVVYAQTDVPNGGRFNSLVRTAADIGASTERAEIVKRALDGGYKAAKLGHWQGVAPIGYRRSAIRDGAVVQVLENGFAKPADCYCVLVPADEAEVELVRFMFEQYVQPGSSLESVLDAVNARRIACGSGGRALRDDLIWSRTAIRQILANPVYLGTVRYGRRPSQRNRRSRQLVLPDEHCVRVEGAHPAIIDADLFERVQAKFTANAVHRRGVRTVYALSGLIRCTTCGSFLVGGGGGRPGRDGTLVHQIYRCAGADRRPRGGSNIPSRLCPPPYGTIARAKLERLVVEALAREFARPDVLGAVREALEARRRAATADSPRARVKRLDREARSLTDRKRNLIGAIERNRLTDADIVARLRALDADLERVGRERIVIESNRDAAQAQDDVAEDLVRRMADLPTLATQLGGDQLRAVIAPWVAEASFDKASRRLVLRIRRVPWVHDAGMTQGTADLCREGAAHTLTIDV